MRVIISGGGTGGHIFPALAIINSLKRTNPEVEILYIGSCDGLEADIIPKENINIKFINVNGFKRKLSFYNLKVLYLFIKSAVKSRRIILDFRADIVIGTGGFVAGPPLFTAKSLKIPTLIHEQNVIPGITNKFLSYFADIIAISYEESRSSFGQQDKVRLTGNPRATDAYLSKKNYRNKLLEFEDDLPLILITGGSGGAEVFNKAILNYLESDYAQTYNFIFLTGSRYYDDIIGKINKKNIKIIDFSYDLLDLLAASKLIITRAGATILAEITALGIPAIMVPSPNVTNNHQYHNAMALEKVGGGCLLSEAKMNNVNINSMIEEILDVDKYPIFVNACKSLGKVSAADEIYKEITLLLRK